MSSPVPDGYEVGDWTVTVYGPEPARGVFENPAPGTTPVEAAARAYEAARAARGAVEGNWLVVVVATKARKGLLHRTYRFKTDAAGQLSPPMREPGP